MKKLLALLLCAAALVSLGACSVHVNVTSDDAETTDTTETAAYDGGAPMIYTEDGDLVIALAGNPTTGYEWSCEVDGDCVSGGDYEYLQDAAAEDMVGVGGVFTFRFTPTKAGTATLRFDYARSWEDEVLDSYEFEVTISGTAGQFDIQCQQTK